MVYKVEYDSLRRALQRQRGGATKSERERGRAIGKSGTYRPWLEATGWICTWRGKVSWWVVAPGVSRVWSVKTSGKMSLRRRSSPMERGQIQATQK